MTETDHCCDMCLCSADEENKVWVEGVRFICDECLRDERRQYANSDRK